MTRRSAPVSYAASLSVGLAPAVASETKLPAPGRQTDIDEPSLGDPVGQGRVRRPLEEKADPSVLYLHPAGKKALRLYAVEKGVKVHDLLLDALEEWATAKGLQGPWRVQSAGPPRRKRSI